MIAISIAIIMIDSNEPTLKIIAGKRFGPGFAAHRSETRTRESLHELRSISMFTSPI